MNKFIFPAMLDIETFYTIEDAMSIGIIPEDYHDIFGKYKNCFCDHPILINNNRTVMKCSNPHCVIKIANRYSEICKQFITGIGPEKAKEMTLSYHYRNIYDAINLSPVYIRDCIEGWLKQPHYIGEIIEFLKLPGIGNISKDLFDNIESMQEMKNNLLLYGMRELHTRTFQRPYTDETYKKLIESFNSNYKNIVAYIKRIEDTGHPLGCKTPRNFLDGLRTLGMIRYIRSRIGGDKNSIRVALTLMDYWEEIESVLHLASVKNVIVDIQPIVITGDILRAKYPNGDSFSSKEAYVAYLNTIAEKVGIMYKLGSALKSTRFIVADTDTPTRKYQEGLATNKLVTSDVLLAAHQKLIDDKLTNKEE